jgi:hypothetical protein
MSSIQLSAFQLFLKRIWPYPHSPHSMLDFCAWHNDVVDKMDGVSNIEKQKYKDNAVETWLKLNIVHGSFTTG